jgi:hypothetical protein
VDHDQATTKALTGYISTRHYHLEFHGVKSLVADLVVRASYHAPNRKEFSVQSEDGSTFLQKRILRKLLDSEVEASAPENRQEIAWTPANYAFRLLGCEEVAGRRSYVLRVNPRHKNKFLVKGTIDVDSEDFALTRIAVEPAVNPSWWTVSNEIEQTYAKTGAFWLPSRNTTTTKVRLLGQALLTIDYGEYQLLEAAHPPASGGGSPAPPQNTPAVSPGLSPPVTQVTPLPPTHPETAGSDGEPSASRKLFCRSPRAYGSFAACDRFAGYPCMAMRPGAINSHQMKSI